MRISLRQYCYTIIIKFVLLVLLLAGTVQAQAVKVIHPGQFQVSGTELQVGFEQQGGWEEFELFNFDIFFNIVNSGVKRFFCELNQRRFLLTTVPEEAARGDYIFYIPKNDTVLMDISAYLKPGFFETTTLRVLTQGEAGSTALLVIGDASGKLKDEVDFVLRLERRQVGDANGDGFTHENDDQFVELVNTSSETIDLSNWAVMTNSGIWHQFPTGTMLNAGEFLVVFGGGSPQNIPGIVQTANLPGASLGWGLFSQQDEIRLFDASFSLIDSVVYHYAEPIGQSITRSPDGSGDFMLMVEARGSGNTLFTPGTSTEGQTTLSPQTGEGVKINEVYFNPAQDNPQFPPAITNFQNYPNPFNGRTFIRFTIPDKYLFGVETRLNIYNSLGQKVRSLMAGKYYPGEFTIEWDARDEAGRPVASGVYIYSLTIDNTSGQKKMILAK